MGIFKKKVKNKNTTIAGIMAILGAIVQAYNTGVIDASIIAMIIAGIGLIKGSDGGL